MVRKLTIFFHADRHGERSDAIQSNKLTGLPQPLRGFAMTLHMPSSINTYWIAAAPAGLRNDATHAIQHNYWLD
jgi:hypothetical protein